MNNFEKEDEKIISKAQTVSKYLPKNRLMVIYPSFEESNMGSYEIFNTSIKSQTGSGIRTDFEDIAFYAECRWEQIWKITKQELDKCRENSDFNLKIHFDLGIILIFYYNLLF